MTPAEFARARRFARIERVANETGCSLLDAGHALDRHGQDERAAIDWLRRSVARVCR